METRSNDQIIKDTVEAFQDRSADFLKGADELIGNKTIQMFPNKLNALRRFENSTQIALVEITTYIDLLNELNDKKAVEEMQVIANSLAAKQQDLQTNLKEILRQLVLDKTFDEANLKETLAKDEQEFLKIFKEANYQKVYSGLLTTEEIRALATRPGSGITEDDLRKKEQALKDWIRENGFLSRVSTQISTSADFDKEIKAQLDAIIQKLKSSESSLTLNGGTPFDVKDYFTLPEEGRALFNAKEQLANELHLVGTECAKKLNDPKIPIAEQNKFKSDILERLKNLAKQADVNVELSKKFEEHLKQAALTKEANRELKEIAFEAESIITKYSILSGETVVPDEGDMKDGLLKDLLHIKVAADELSLTSPIDAGKLASLRADAKNIFAEGDKKIKELNDAGGPKPETFLDLAKQELQKLIFQLKDYENEFKRLKLTSDDDNKALAKANKDIAELNEAINQIEKQLATLTDEQKANLESVLDKHVERFQRTQEKLGDRIETKKLFNRCDSLLRGIESEKNLLVQQNYDDLKAQLTAIQKSLGTVNDFQGQRQNQAALNFVEKEFSYYAKVKEKLNEFENLKDLTPEQQANLTTLLDNAVKKKITADDDVGKLLAELDTNFNQALGLTPPAPPVPPRSQPVSAVPPLTRRSYDLTPQEEDRLKNSFKDYKKLFDTLEAKLHEINTDLNLATANKKIEDLRKICRTRWEQLDLYSLKVAAGSSEAKTIEKYMRKFEDLYHQIPVSATARFRNYQTLNFNQETIIIKKTDIPAGQTREDVIQGQLAAWGIPGAGVAAKPAAMSSRAAGENPFPGGAIMHRMRMPSEVAGVPDAVFVNVQKSDHGVNTTEFYCSGQLPERKFYQTLPHELHLAWAMKSIQDHLSADLGLNSAIDINQGLPPYELTKDHVEALLICAKYLKDVEGRKDVILFNYTQFPFIPTDAQTKAFHKLLMKNAEKHFPATTVELAKTLKTRTMPELEKRTAPDTKITNGPRKT